MNVYASFEPNSSFDLKQQSAIKDALMDRIEGLIVNIKDSLHYDEYDSLESVEEQFIRKTHIYIAFLEKGSRDMMFELGMAFALGKRILIISCMDGEIPVFLRNLPMIHHKPEIGIQTLIPVLHQAIRIVGGEKFTYAERVPTALYRKAFDLTFEEIEDLPPADFVALLFGLFERLGLKPEISALDFDHGFDFRIRNFERYDNTLVEIKRYNLNTKVGINQIEQFYGVIMANNADAGIFITTSEFTSSAESFAQKIKPRIILFTMAEFLKKYETRL